MDDDAVPHQLINEVFIANAFPEHVFNHIQSQGFGPENLMPMMMPDHVVEEIWRNQALQQPPPLPNMGKNYWCEYIVPHLEQRFLMWEVEWLRWHLMFYACVLLLVLFLHYASCSRGAERHGLPCGSQYLLVLGVLLVWLPIIGTLMPLKLLYQYRDVMCGIHQVLFGFVVASFATEFKTDAAKGYERVLSPWYLCTLPVLIESVLARVRLRYHFVVNTVLISFAVHPWFLGPLSNLQPVQQNLQFWIGNFTLMFVVPGCLVVLYEFHQRQRFETTIR